MAKKRREGDIYTAFLKAMGKTPKVGTPLKAPPKPKSLIGGSGRGGSTSAGRPKGGGKSGGSGKTSVGRARPGGKGRVGRGRAQAPKGAGDPGRKMKPDSKKAQKMIDQALENEQEKTPRDPNLPESGPGSEGGRHGLRKVRAAQEAADDAAAAEKRKADANRAAAVEDIPPQQSLSAEPMPPRPAEAPLPDPRRTTEPPRSRQADQDEYKPTRAERKAIREEGGDPNYARTWNVGSREHKMDPSEFGRFATPKRYESEVDVVQQAINTPTPLDIEELLNDPRKHLPVFIEAFGEDKVPPEVWDALEGPRGDDPSAYPYPAGAEVPPTAPPPPTDMGDPYFYRDLMAPAAPTAMPPGSMPVDPMMPGGVPPPSAPVPRPEEEEGFDPSGRRRFRMPD